MGWLDAKTFYKRGDKPRFKVGDKVFKIVEIRPNILKRTLRFCVEYTVEEVSSKKSGLFFKEFTYVIKEVGTDKLYDGIYESELFTEFKHIDNPNTDDPDWWLDYFNFE